MISISNKLGQRGSSLYAVTLAWQARLSLIFVPELHVCTPPAEILINKQDHNPKPPRRWLPGPPFFGHPLFFAYMFHLSPVPTEESLFIYCMGAQRIARTRKRCGCLDDAAAEGDTAKRKKKGHWQTRPRGRVHSG